MQWLDLRRVGTTETKLGKVVKAVMAPHHREFGILPCEFQSPDYKLKVYAKKIAILPDLVKKLNEEAQKEEELEKPPLKKKRGTEFLLFYYRKVPEREIVVLSSGQAFRVIKGCVHQGYPARIAEYLLDPKNIVELCRRPLVGPNLEEKLLHPSGEELYKISTLYYLVESIQCSVKSNAALLGLPPFSSTKKSKAPVVKVTMGGLLRIVKRIAIEDYPAIFRLFYQYTHREPTFGTDGKAVVPDPLFEFLHFVQPAQVDASTLDQELVEAIWKAYQEGEPLPASFRHRFVYEFLSADQFAIQYAKKGRFKDDLPARPPTLQEIVEKMEQDNPSRTSDTFLSIWREGQLRFVDQAKRLHEECLIDCLEAEVRYQDESYFKIRGKWYQLTADYNALLIDDFRTILRARLLKRTDGGQLPRTWMGNTVEDKVKETDVKAFVGGKGIRKFMDSLYEEKMSYLSDKGTVQQSRLSGAILELPLIATHRGAIEKALQPAPGSVIARLKKAFPNDHQAIVDALKEERPILEESGEVLNPAAYPFWKELKGQEAAFLTYLEKLCDSRGKAVDEETYCRSYLSDKNYLVFDQILPNNIEPCDIVKYDDKTTRLYHVKENFGQHTRDACSQILNAARNLRAALSTHQSQDYLRMLWKKATNPDAKGWRKKTKEACEALGKSQFLRLFTERKIIFVYAYLEKKGASFHAEATTPTRLTPAHLGGREIFQALKKEGFLDQRNRLSTKFYDSTQATFSLKGFETTTLEIYKKLDALRPISDSTLAKLDLIHVARELQALNFDFEICEIARPDSAAPPPNSAADENYDTASEEEESAEAVTGPSGLTNIGNSCYLNACLQPLYYLQPLRALATNKFALLSEAIEQRSKTALLKLRKEIFLLRAGSILEGSETAQHDAHDLLCLLLDQLDWRPMVTYNYISYKIPGKGEGGHKSGENSTNHLSIAIEEGKSFQELIDGYFLPEKKNEPCVVNKKLTVDRFELAIKIEASPDTLIIHLKRFENKLKKLDCAVAFPADRRVTVQGDEYEIIAFINHLGSSIDGGHYTADVRDLTAGEERWLHCNDATVREVEPSDPDSKAYIVFLRKVE